MQTIYEIFTKMKELIRMATMVAEITSTPETKIFK